MPEYDRYITINKPALGICIRQGAGLPDFADPKECVFDGPVAPRSVVSEYRGRCRL